MNYPDVNETEAFFAHYNTRTAATH